MKPYFDTDERIAKLLFHAGEWKGTPWVANSEVLGVGVSCHNLPRAIEIKCGALREDFPRVVGSPAQSKHTKESAMIPFLDSRPEFVRVYLHCQPIMPGDILGIRIYNCVDHLGIALTNNQFAHVLMHKLTGFDDYTMPPWLQRIEAAWRPIEIL